MVAVDLLWSNRDRRTTMRTMRATMLGVLAMGTLIVASAAAPAWADRDGWHGRGHWEHREWRPPVVVYAPQPQFYYRPAPQVVYVPPAYYAPPPVYYAPPSYVAPGVSVGFGFNLR
jgi:hypothetical protein